MVNIPGESASPNNPSKTPRNSGKFGRFDKLTPRHSLYNLSVSTKYVFLCFFSLKNDSKLTEPKKYCEESGKYVCFEKIRRVKDTPTHVPTLMGTPKTIHAFNVFGFRGTNNFWFQKNVSNLTDFG